ncbi:MAG: hypothetical protein ACXVHJ_05240 [Solirubrobacteraceae bacterium]
MGFKKVQQNIESEGKSPAAAAAIAASIGRKKYGGAAMARAARTRTKLGPKRK